MKLKRLLAIYISLIAALSLSMNIQADDTTTANPAVPSTGPYSITIEETEAGHEFSAYQIFKGTAVEGEPTLGNIEWGDNVDASRIPTLAADAAGNPFGIALSPNMPAAKIAEAMEGIAKNTTADVSAKVHDCAMFFLTTSGFLDLATPTAVAKAPTANVGYVLTGLTPGYYLITDNLNPANPSEAAASAILLEVAHKNLEVEPKKAVPTVSKLVKKTPQPAVYPDGDNDGWADSADYAIGDMVPFVVNSILPENIKFYATYQLKFTDTYGTGLTFDPANAEMKFYMNDTEIQLQSPGDYELATADGTFTLTIKNALKLPGYKPDQDNHFTFKYQMKLNENAVTAPGYNQNTIKLTYPNNPTQTTNPTTSDTSESTAKVYTFKLQINKTDEAGNPLTGADFELIPVAADGTQGTAIKPTKTPADNPTTFTFTGLASGEYILKETQTPASYNTMPDRTFTIHGVYAEPGTPAAGTQQNISRLVLKEIQSTDKDMTNDGPNKTGTLLLTIINMKGAMLPSTGTLGLISLLIIGLLLIGGGLYLRKKSSHQA